MPDQTTPASADDLTLERRTVNRFGWKPSLPDTRDLIADASEIKILAEVDPRADLSTPYDQGNLGSCTANATGAAAEYDAALNGTPFASRPSRLFIYYGEREIEGSVGYDAGAYGRDGFKVMHKVGVPDEQTWGYDISRFAEKPPPEAYGEAPRHKIGPYKAVRRSVRQMKAVLSNRQTVAFGFSVFESFESDEVARTGLVPEPVAGERMLGGHEVLIVGYLKDYPHHALCRNSWGTGWGIAGYFLFPWSMILDSNVSGDFRTVYRPLGA